MAEQQALLEKLVEAAAYSDIGILAHTCAQDLIHLKYDAEFSHK